MGPNRKGNRPSRTGSCQSLLECGMLCPNEHGNSVQKALMAIPKKSEPHTADAAAEREMIEEFADRRVQARGARVYQDTYSKARTMKEAKATVTTVRETLLRPPTAPVKDKAGFVPLAKRKEFEAEKRMTTIRDQAIKDAMQGRPASYR